MNLSNLTEKLNCKSHVECQCKIGQRCKYFEFEGSLKPECKDPYANTEEVYNHDSSL